MSLYKVLGCARYECVSMCAWYKCVPDMSVCEVRVCARYEGVCVRYECVRCECVSEMLVCK